MKVWIIFHLLENVFDNLFDAPSERIEIFKLENFLSPTHYFLP